VRLSDLDDAEVEFGWQVDRKGNRRPTKTDGSARTVPIPRELAMILAKHNLASRNSQPDAYVFATSTGRPLSQRNVGRALRGSTVDLCRPFRSSSRLVWLGGVEVDEVAWSRGSPLHRAKVLERADRNPHASDLNVDGPLSQLRIRLDPIQALDDIQAGTRRKVSTRARGFRPGRQRLGTHLLECLDREY
jgi:hypothetical protein